MKYLSKIMLGCSLFAILPVVAQGAGTYYNGATYRSPQTGYNTQSYAQRSNTGYTRTNNYSNYSSYATTPARTNTAVRTTQQNAQRQAANTNTASNAGKKGFWLDAAFAHEISQWQFEMAGSSILHFDNIGWNVFDVKAGYAFDMGKIGGQIDAGFKYGMQSGDSFMVDDDVTNGGGFETEMYETCDENGNCTGYIGDLRTRALSVGSTDGGSMMGFNVGFGLTDVFKVGAVRFTPSIGYRYLKYKLETKNNYGMMMETLECFESDGEIRCDPVILISYDNGTVSYMYNKTDQDGDGFWDIGSGANGILPENTVYFEQPGVSHSYEVEWAGPYLALDMDYVINANNAVNARVELGLPGYTATGDQPYRFDWAHPESVKDEAGMFGGFHLGLGANWQTAITNTLSLSVGLTYDYYSVSDADATTNFNPDYYMAIYDQLLDAWKAEGLGETEMLENDPLAIYINDMRNAGWVAKDDGIIESFYKSMGIRVGISARF